MAKPGFQVRFRPIVSPTSGGGPDHIGTYEPAASKSIRALLSTSKYVREACLVHLQAIPVPIPTNPHRLVRFSPAHHFICVHSTRDLNYLDTGNWLKEPADCWSDPLNFEIRHLAFNYYQMGGLGRAVASFACIFEELRGPLFGAHIELPRRDGRANLPLEVALPDEDEHVLSPVGWYMVRRYWQMLDDSIWNQIRNLDQYVSLTCHLRRSVTSRGLLLY